MHRTWINKLWCQIQFHIIPMNDVPLAMRLAVKMMRLHVYLDEFCLMWRFK